MSAVRRLGPFDIPLVGSRHVRVFAPPRAPDHHPAPVLYMFDGQNVFDDAPSFAGGWHLHDIVGAIAKRHGRAPVIVAVEHGGVERIHELIPWASERGGGRTDALIKWIADELAPRMHAELNVSKDPAHVGIGGSSLGGLAALYGHFSRPDRFGLVLAMSPSLFVSHGRIFEVIASTSRPWTSRIYLDAGALEAGGGMLRSAERLAGELRQRGWDDGSLKFVAAKRAAHTERAWRRRAPSALTWLFVPNAPSTPRRRPPRGSK